MTTPRKDRLAHLVRQFGAGAIDKFEFYHLTRDYPAAEVAAAGDIPLEVIQDRRRYLGQLAQQTEDEPKGG
jgi:hypothetical protein